jgi:hypothetical protein
MKSQKAIQALKQQTAMKAANAMKAMTAMTPPTSPTVIPEKETRPAGRPKSQLKGASRLQHLYVKVAPCLAFRTRSSN